MKNNVGTWVIHVSCLMKVLFWNWSHGIWFLAGYVQVGNVENAKSIYELGKKIILKKIQIKKDLQWVLKLGSKSLTKWFGFKIPCLMDGCGFHFFPFVALCWVLRCNGVQEQSRGWAKVGTTLPFWLNSRGQWVKLAFLREKANCIWDAKHSENELWGNTKMNMSSDL